MRNQVLAVIPRNITVQYSSDILRLAATAVDPFSVIFSFLDFQSLTNFYKSILKTHGSKSVKLKNENGDPIFSDLMTPEKSKELKAAQVSLSFGADSQLAVTRKLTLQSIIKAVPRTPASIALQEKLIRQSRFFQALDDDLIRTVLLSPHSPNELKLKVLLENIISQYGEIPASLEIKLFQHVQFILKSRQFHQHAYFQLYFSYLEKHHKSLITQKILENLDPRTIGCDLSCVSTRSLMCFRLEAIHAVFPGCLNQNQKIYLGKIITRLRGENSVAAAILKNILQEFHLGLEYNHSFGDKKIDWDEILDGLAGYFYDDVEKAGISLCYAFPLLSPEDQKIFFEKIEKLYSEKTLGSFQMSEIGNSSLVHKLSRYLVFQNDAFKNRIGTTSAIMGFTIPHIQLTLSQNDFLRISRRAENMYQKKQEKINEDLLSINIIFYEHFIKPDDINLNELKAQFENLIKTVQQKRFSIGFFSRAPGDTHSAAQLIAYFKTPQSLKARALLQKAFGEVVFSKNSVNDIKEFEASLKKLMVGILHPSANRAATEKAPIQSPQH